MTSSRTFSAQTMSYIFICAAFYRLFYAMRREKDKYFPMLHLPPHRILRMSRERLRATRRAKQNTYQVKLVKLLNT